MERSPAELKEQRIQKLFDDCQQQVVSQIIGPFGLSTAMFEDRNGGNVTTLNNFSQENPDYIAEKDKEHHAQSRKEYDREDYSDPAFAKKSTELRSGGKDGYTGKRIASGEMDLDHVTSLKTLSQDKKVHLALETGESLDRVKQMANSDENLVATHRSINRSKGAGTLAELSERKGAEYKLKQKLVVEAQQRSDDHVSTAVTQALIQKQGTELLETGGIQSAQMGLRQALGVLLTELVNGLFNEFKVLIKRGVEAGKTLFEEIRQRLALVIESVARKIPDALSQMFEGGVGGFMSNLLTFLINNFLATAKRFVTAIRQGIVGLYRAFKMIFFPPEHMTAAQAMQEGLKILTAVVVTTLGVLLQESVSTFMATIPFLKPVADLVAPVLIGIVTGLLSAFLAYQIDCLFDRYLRANGEKLMDELMADAKRRDEFATELVTLSESSLNNVANYSKSISWYQEIGANLAAAAVFTSATCASLAASVSETRLQVEKSREMVSFINSSQSEIDDFLRTV